MTRKFASLQNRLYLIAAIILLAGSATAIFIYMAADSTGGSEYDGVGGYISPLAPEDSKKFQHDLELYGGKTNVLENELTRWLAGLWHGESLAFTIVCLTILTSAVLFVIANHIRHDAESRSHGESRQ